MKTILTYKTNQKEFRSLVSRKKQLESELTLVNKELHSWKFKSTLISEKTIP